MGSIFKMRKLDLIVRKWERRDIVNYTIHCCNNIDYLLTIKKGYQQAMDLTEREKRQYCVRIDSIIRRQLGRIKAREYLEMLENSSNSQTLTSYEVSRLEK